MRKNFACFVLMLFICFSLFAQLNESFSDGNFTTDPFWTGNTTDWQIITSSDVAIGAVNSNTLRLNAIAGSGVSYLSTQVTGNWGSAQSWGFFVGRRGQAYTAVNHMFIWLWASEPNLLSPTINGYRIRIGDDSGDDDLILEKVTNGVVTVILTGVTALPNNLTDVGFLLRITRSNAGKWEIFTSTLPSANGSGAVATDIPNAVNAGISQGSITDNTYAIFDNGYTGFVNAYGSGAPARATQEFDQVQLSFINGAMPVKLGSFNAYENGTGVRLAWNVLEETNVMDYEIQANENGMNFSSLGTVKAENRKSYAFMVDHRMHEFYRLKIIDFDGNAGYSHIINLRAKVDPVITVTLNPASTILNIEHPRIPVQSRLQLISSGGELIQQLVIPPNTAHSKLNMSGLPAGCYQLILITPQQRTGKMIVKK